MPIDDDGKALDRSYKTYYRRFHGDAFEASFNCDATSFATRFLATANIILNVSAVLFSREALVDVQDQNLDELATYRFAGDWITYLYHLPSARRSRLLRADAQQAPPA
jgi:hypothetical protein